MTKLMLVFLVVALALPAGILAQSLTNIVIAVDLSQSVAVRGPDGKSEFQKNIEAAATQLAQVPPDTSVTVVGITDHSFTRPDILPSASLTADAGYLGERLKTGENGVGSCVEGPKRETIALLCSHGYSRSTALAGQIFNQHPSSNRKLILYSDMRQSTPELDMEGKSDLPTVSEVTQRSRAADLHDVRVFVLGVDGAGKSTGFWQALQKFWLEYFRKSGAEVKSFLVVR